MLAITNNKRNMPGASLLTLMIITLLLLAGCAPGSEETSPLPAPTTVVQDQAQTREREEILEEHKGTESLEEDQQEEKNQDLEEKLDQEEHEQKQKELNKGEQLPKSKDIADESTTVDTTVSAMEVPITSSSKAQVTIRSMEELPDIITDQPVAWEPGDTVLDLLVRVTREHRIQLAYRGRGRTAYVEGINNLYEFDHGPASGWVYSVNGVFPDRSAGGWETAAEDNIIWWYTLDAGRDAGVFPQ